MEKSTPNLNELLVQKERALAAVEKDAIELRKQIDVLRQTIALLSNRTGYEDYLASSQIAPAALPPIRQPNETLTLTANPASVAESAGSPVPPTIKQHGSLTEAIIGMLDPERGQTVEEIFNAIKASSSLQLSRDSVAKTLSRLNSQGKVTKVGFATYCLAT